MVSEGYSIVQNLDAFRFFDAVAQDPNGAKYHTAGSLHGGKRIWMLAKLPTFVKVSDEDIVEEYLLLSNGHDGANSLNMMFTPVRVVCQNTLTRAENRATRAFRHFHTGNIQERIVEAQDVLGIARAAHEDFESQVNALSHFIPSASDIDATLTKLFPMPDPNKGLTPAGLKSEITYVTNRRQEITDIFRNDSTCNTEGARGTGWGLYNALTHIADHGGNSERSDDSRVASNWYGTSASFKAKSLDAVLALLS